MMAYAIRVADAEVVTQQSFIDDEQQHIAVPSTAKHRKHTPILSSSHPTTPNLFNL
eukprot:m.16521 g.16521  ORF g.16521 m.16521 type:complete len:56 (-) comp9035_c0_seq1:6-173(-)